VIRSIDNHHLRDNSDEYDGTGDYSTIDENSYYVVLQNDALTEYLMANPELADDVIDAINERGTTEVPVIKNIIESGEKALRGGAL